MAHIHGASVASQATNAHLRDWQARARQPGCAEDLRRTDRFFAAEYPAGPMPQIAQADILFRDRLTLALGEVTAELFRVVSPHTEDSTCVYLPEKRLLFWATASARMCTTAGFWTGAGWRRWWRPSAASTATAAC